MQSELESKFLELLRKPVKSKHEIQEMQNIRQKLEAELRSEISDLNNELRGTGIECDDVWDLVNTKKSYPKAIPILIKHLPKNYHYKNKEGIVRALSVKEAIGKASRALIEEYNRTPKEQEAYRWAIGNSVYTTITSDDIEEVLKIVTDKSNGPSRHMFILALGKFRSEKVDQILTDLLRDKEVAAYASEALGRINRRK